MVAWQLLYHSRSLGDQPPQYDDCPAPCPDDGEMLFSFCDTCPRKESEEGFRADCEGYLNERLGDRWQRYGFEQLYGDVLSTLALEDSKDLTVTAAACVAIVKSERRKMERIDAWNAKQKAK